MSENTPPDRPCRGWIPSAVTLTQLPEAALQLARHVRDWLPGEAPTAPPPAEAGAALADRMSDRIGFGHDRRGRERALALLRLIREEVGSGMAPRRTRGWHDPLLVWAALDKLDVALKALVARLGWAELDGAVGYEIQNEGAIGYGKDGKPLETPAGVAKIASTTPPVPAPLLDALEHAADRLSRVLRPTLERAAAEARPAEERSGGLLDVMREAIRSKGIGAKPECLIKAARVRQQPGRQALRQLESSGEYKGFARKPPRRQK